MPSPLSQSRNSLIVYRFAVFGIYTRLAYDEEYQSFMILLQQVISVNLTSEILFHENRLFSVTDHAAEVADLSAKYL